jgi:hypothetical protein
MNVSKKQMNKVLCLFNILLTEGLIYYLAYSKLVCENKFRFRQYTFSKKII